MADKFVPSVALVEWKSIEGPDGHAIVDANKDYDLKVQRIVKGIRVYTFEQIKSGPEWDVKLHNTVTAVMEIVRMPTTMFEEHREIWVKTFTAASYYFKSNYEILEKTGDATAKDVLMSILRDMFPDITPQTMSETVSHVLSKQVQGEVSKKLGWAGTLRTGFVKEVDGKIEYDYTTSTAEDIFESIFGAIAQVGEFVQKGAGFFYAKNLMKWLINNGYLVVKRNYELPPRTAVDQLFAGKRWGKVVKVYTKNGDKHTCKLRLTGPAIRDLKHNSSTINFTTDDMRKLVDNPEEELAAHEDPHYIALADSEYFGVGNGHDKDSAMMAAYVDGAKKLREIGILTNIDAARGYSQFTTIDLLPYYRRAYLKAKKLGYSNIYASSKAKKEDDTKSAYDAQLFGYKPNGDIDTLITATIPKEIGVSMTDHDLRIFLYTRYAELK